MKDDLVREIKKLESRGIIAKVGKPTNWISHIHQARKPNGKIPVCIDPQNLNKAIKRNHTVLPALDDVLPKLNKAKYFSLCDAKEGFDQVPLEDASYGADHLLDSHWQIQIFVHALWNLFRTRRVSKKTD